MFQSFAVFEAVLPGTDVPLYLFSHAAFSPPHLLWEDEDWRFTLFANGAAEFCWNYWKPKLSIAMTGYRHDSSVDAPILGYQQRLHDTTCLSRTVDGT